MELTDYISILRKYWLSVLGLLVSGLIAAASVTFFMTPVFTASTSLFFTVNGADTVGDLNQGSTYANTQVKSYMQVVTTQTVLQPVIERLELTMSPSELAQSVSTTVPTNTAILEISVTNADATQSASIANAIAAQMRTVVTQLSPQSDTGAKRVTATVIQPAAVPTSATSPSLALNLSLGAILGLLLGVGQAVLRSRLDITVVSEQDVADVTERSVVGVVAFDSEAAHHPLVFESAPHSARAEAYRHLRTNVQFLELGLRRNSIVVSSSVVGEGKTSTAINLAGALADTGRSVLLVEADLRRPSIAPTLGLDGTVGLTDVVIGRARLADVVQPVARGNLHALPAGSTPPNPAELLGSRPMEDLLDRAMAEYDIVIVDSPPLLPVTDAALLARVGGGVLLVAGCGVVTKPQLAASIGSLEHVEAEILGLVLNRRRAGHGDGYGRQRYDYGAHSGPDLTFDTSVRRASRRAMPIAPQELIVASGKDDSLPRSLR
ncbi:polysaccharide biosynthesis tyrosine autokinase [Propionicicella superfundia]|uniref:polysaccharide biosynthesis tyrosine autokinase n=1 Tax=Propionicicella superfundia TaxID=348582 RepID=UPI0004285F8F|nr:polysaccharide biosynthesis tyrosine autokinase [Propionicicella superfundia]